MNSEAATAIGGAIAFALVVATVFFAFNSNKAMYYHCITTGVANGKPIENCQKIKDF